MRKFSLKKGLIILTFLFHFFIEKTFAVSPTTFPCYNGYNGNINCDPLGIVNNQDLSILLSKWNPVGPAPTPPLNQYSVDLNGDNKINEIDVSLMLTNWGFPRIPTIPPIPTLSPPPNIPNFVPDGRMNQTLVSVPDQGMGLCWWVSPAVGTSNFVNWAYDVGYFWSHIEPNEGSYNFSYYDQSLDYLRGKAKGYLLYFDSAGIYQGVEKYPQWLINKVKQNNPKHWIAYTDGGEPHGHFIAPWDPDWQSALDRLAYNLAFKYDNDPNVIGVVIPSGCRYGEMSCWPRNDTEKHLWENAGYTDQKFTTAVEQVITIFLKYFQKKPVYVQLGSGLYGQGNTTCWKLMREMYAAYGLRVRYKKNSWGSTGTDNDTTNQYYRKYGPYTNVGWEAGYQFNFSSESVSQQIIETAITYESSYGCLGIELLQKWQNVWIFFSKYAGTHIIMESSEYSPTQVLPNQNININITFLNRGNKPLVAPKRVGVKDEPASYVLAVYFINKNTGSEIRKTIQPSIPTNEWYGGYYTPREKIVNENVPAPNSPGRYDIRIALENPYPGPHYKETWPIITEKTKDSKNRYFIGEVQVINP